MTYILTTNITFVNWVRTDVALVNWQQMSSSFSRVQNQPFGLACREETQGTLVTQVHSWTIEIFKKYLSTFLPILIAPFPAFSQQNSILIWIYLKLIKKTTMPNLLHMIKVLNLPILNRPVKIQKTTVFMSLISNLIMTFIQNNV